MGIPKWSEVEARMSLITDKMGKGIDQGIFETVVALNALGITTTQSCEGHLDWGLAAPWVDIDPPGEIAQMRAQLRLLPDEEARVIREALKQRQGLAFHELSQLLGQFYALRPPIRAPMEYQQMLILSVMGGGRIRLEPIGLEAQAILPPDQRATNLRCYQQHMRDFTCFLKTLLPT